MEDARITDLVREFQKSDGMLSNRRLTELGFSGREVAEAKSAGIVLSTGDGPWDTVFLVEDTSAPAPAVK